ncbi:UNVERIFIED_CONTAM: hypothetical protein Slati_1764600 [Sesamum latifolium]|uniref:Uncharacterized protein n=1 Tax=Sesamum latifolium TaxID=2727402 RepID=A0AAW2WWW6_9LAMI
MVEATPVEEEEGKWLLHVDGPSTYSSSGARVMLTSRERDELEFFLRFNFKASNNEAKYEALTAGIIMVLDVGVRALTAYSNSLLNSTNWRELFLDYLWESTLPAEENEATRLKSKAI